MEARKPLRKVGKQEGQPDDQQNKPTRATKARIAPPRHAKVFLASCLP